MPTDEAAPAPVAESELVLRPADEDDADALALIHLLARRAAPMPDPVHSDDDVRRWLRERVADHAPGAETWVAEVEGVPVGYARTTAGWLDDLYVQPAHQGTGVGAALLDLATARQPDGFCLWVFESNRPAREFYARHGLVELERMAQVEAGGPMAPAGRREEQGNAQAHRPFKTKKRPEKKGPRGTTTSPGTYSEYFETNGCRLKQSGCLDDEVPLSSISL